MCSTQFAENNIHTSSGHAVGSSLSVGGVQTDPLGSCTGRNTKQP